MNKLIQLLKLKWQCWKHAERIYLHLNWSANEHEEPETYKILFMIRSHPCVFGETRCPTCWHTESICAEDQVCISYMSKE